MNAMIFMTENRKPTWLAALMMAGLISSGIAAENNSTTATPAQFAPLAQNHELAAIWNDADFQRRLVGSYGFASEAEPKLQPDELEKYRTVVVPILTNSDPKKIIATLEGLTGPKASAVFDFTLGNVYFQREDLTNAVKPALLRVAELTREVERLRIELAKK